ncbi:hypothetical protein [Roseovarius sp. M141]|uniref:hypothetical protein n=1 Tax=Roseovarius sp. M141 TaxID=2583806 RepID=UPI0020CE94D0|nr:hypothetical protein [Roseovarius sp. M141]
MSNDATKKPGSSPLAPLVAQMQGRTEALYLRSKALEQQVRHLEATHPVICMRPAAGGLVSRLAWRVIPALRRRREVQTIRDCGLFDGAWYLAQYADVREAGGDPAGHYLRFGATELRDPGPWFSTAHYLHLYPDIAQVGINPLLHYLHAGWREGRAIRPGMATGPGEGTV